jgi:nitroimidazol reductase NimA-like FMN-containing flavoprotein (pyridoxamine 5'-phosphate oxidase superfamily)
MKLSRTDADFIKSQGVARLATVSADGTPHNVPVCAVVAGGRLYVASDKNAKKVKNIEGHSSAAIVFDVYVDSWKRLRGLMLECRCRLVDEKEFKRVRRSFYTRYPKYEADAPLAPEDSVIVELIPTKKFRWGFE